MATTITSVLLVRERMGPRPKSVRAPVHPTNACDDAGARNVVLGRFVARKLRQLEERRAGIQQPVHALARQQLALACVALAGLCITALRELVHLGTQVVHER